MPNGATDTNFGVSGLVETEFGGGKNQETAYGLAEDASGDILAIGNANVASGGGFDIARYTGQGLLDTRSTGPAN